MSRNRKSPPLTADNKMLQRLSCSLFSDDADRAQFVASLVKPPEFAVAVVWIRDRPVQLPFETLPAPPWLPDYVDLVSIAHRPGRHPLHEQGDYYCLDPSSVFSSQVMSVPDPDSVRTIIDVCASPGGKSVLAARRFRPQQLICNEVIGKRTAQLIANLNRCRIENARVMSVDAARLGDQIEAADLVIVDAPCSGQSLIARGKESPGCFHPATVNLNANRQRRILANSVRLVRPGGYLAYMTCTYSLKENERNLEWLLRGNSDFTPQPVPLLASHSSPYTAIPCYRIWPFDSVGAGGFAALLRRQNSPH